MDGIVENLLDQPGGALLHINPTEDLQEDPDDVLPTVLLVWVIVPFLVVDGFEAGPEDRQEDRAPTRVLILGVKFQDRTENLVLA